MGERFIIDGNNLLHAVRVLGPLRTPGREKLLRIIERWALDSNHNVTLAFDGPTPRGNFGEQMKSGRIEVVFSESRTADDCIVERLHHSSRESRALVVSDDSAIQYEARRQGCKCISTSAFIALLFPIQSTSKPKDVDASGEPEPETLQKERENWLELFDDGKSDEPFDGFDAMDH